MEIKKTGTSAALFEEFQNLIAIEKIKYHHTATKRGYQSRKPNEAGLFGRVEKYNGRFGRGFMEILPRWDTTQYVTVRYYLFAD